MSSNFYSGCIIISIQPSPLFGGWLGVMAYTIRHTACLCGRPILYGFANDCISNVTSPLASRLGSWGYPTKELIDITIKAWSLEVSSHTPTTGGRHGQLEIKRPTPKVLSCHRHTRPWQVADVIETRQFWLSGTDFVL